MKHSSEYQYGFGGPSFGLLGAAAAVIALLDWFAILLTGRALGGATFVKTSFLGWRARVLAYGAFLRDEYPPFGNGNHPVTLVIADPPPVRSGLTVLFRIFLALPQTIILALLGIPAVLVWLLSWVMLVIAGSMPAGFWRYLRGWVESLLRLEAYLLLLHDELPPFGISTAPAQAPPPP